MVLKINYQARVTIQPSQIWVQFGRVYDLATTTLVVKHLTYVNTFNYLYHKWNMIYIAFPKATT